LDVIWLVNKNGDYDDAVDRKGLLRNFTIEHLSSERSMYGARRPLLGPIISVGDTDRHSINQGHIRKKTARKRGAKRGLP